MTTSQFITHLVRMGNSSMTRAQLLALVNDCQNEILDIDTPLTRLRPDPVLPTTSGTYNYTVDAATITAISTDGRLARRVRKVFTTATIPSDYNTGRAYGLWSDGGVNAIGMRIYESHPAIQESVGPVNSSAYFPVIRFDANDDPGTTTDVFRLECYMWPTQLTSESVAMTIPDGHQRKVLQSRVMMELELMEYGRSIEWEQRFDRQMKEFQSAMQRNLTSDINHIQFRDF